MITNFARLAAMCALRNGAPDTDRMIEAIMLSDDDAARISARSAAPAEPFARRMVARLECATTMPSEHVRAERNAVTVRR